MMTLGWRLPRRHSPQSLRQCLAPTGFEGVKRDDDPVPAVQRRQPALVARTRIALRWRGPGALGKLQGLAPAAFSEDLVAVARTI